MALSNSPLMKLMDKDKLFNMADLYYGQKLYWEDIMNDPNINIG